MAPGLTVLVPGQVGLGLVAWPGLPGLVDRHDPELIPLALAKTRHPRLKLVNGGAAVVIVGNQGVKPAAKFVFLLNYEMCNGATSVISGLVPS